MTADEERIYFKWNEHQPTITNFLSNIRKLNILTDAIVICEGKFIQVHKFILSACSSHFKEIFDMIDCKCPVVILKDINLIAFESILDFIYYGEIEVEQGNIRSLLEAAECLKIKGLCLPDEDRKELQIATDEPNDVDRVNFFSKTGIEEDNGPKKSVMKTELKSIEKNNILPTLLYHGPNKSLNASNNETPEQNSSISAVKRSLDFSNDKIALSPTAKSTNSKNASLPISNSRKRSLNNGEISKSLSAFNQNSDLSEYSSQPKIKNITRSIKSSTSQVDESINVTEPKLKSSKSTNSHYVQVTHKRRNKDSLNKKKCLSSSSSGSNQKTFIIKHDKKSSVKSPQRLSSKSNNKINPKPKSLLLAEEFGENSGLPEFPESLLPYFEGHDIESKKMEELETILIKTLSTHYIEHGIHDALEARSARTKFYRYVQTDLLNRYPNIIKQECNERFKLRGPLGHLFHKLALCLSAKKRTMIKNASRKNARKPSSSNFPKHSSICSKAPIQHEEKETLSYSFSKDFPIRSTHSNFNYGNVEQISTEKVRLFETNKENDTIRVKEEIES